GKQQLYACIKYIHMNPVKAKIVKNEEDYIYSSYNDYLNRTGFINKRILDFLFNSTNDYIETFKSIEYEELNFEEEQIDIQNILNHFLVKEKISLKEIPKN